MISYRVGDATDLGAGPWAILHIGNDLGAWGAGFTAALDRRWPHVGAEYRQAFRSKPPVLGDVLVSRVSSDTGVYTLIAQGGLIGYGNPVPLQLDALRQTLVTVRSFVDPAVPLHMPRIGCGLAGGRWSDVEPVLASGLPEHHCIVYDWDVHKKSPK